ncbi:hypothetical protein Hbl1158_16960 (plasmid) [Halobaculum sp. CBA1158]|uniref:hypothetical protein n=1 Tax=Halobaculum sp. CBA1158 TaxID=2904243 RepID=UPI001F217F83|nr:hypothetical protein [Halobaculum sp. CBA1158]UIP01745.1 hypothetical protein Hbl1158_16960 [Halobaculum sp. CBA1158]
MTRLIPTAVAGFAVLFIGFRSLSTASDEANTATSSAALNATDAGVSAVGVAAGVTIPSSALVAAISLILAFGYVVVR